MPAHLIAHPLLSHSRAGEKNPKHRPISFPLPFLLTHLKQILHRFQMVLANWNPNSSSKPFMIKKEEEEGEEENTIKQLQSTAPAN